MVTTSGHFALVRPVSVLFNEPKLLKSVEIVFRRATRQRFSALQRAEIAEIRQCEFDRLSLPEFQCSSTSRNC